MAKRRRRASKACHAGTISFKTRRGKKVSFHGHSGKSCPARKKPSTRHLQTWKGALASASRSCSRKHSGKAFRSCVGKAVRAAG